MADFRPGFTQVAVLSVLLLGLALFGEWHETPPPRASYLPGVLNYAPWCLLVLAVIATMAGWLRLHRRALWLTTSLLSAGTWVMAAALGVRAIAAALGIVDRELYEPASKVALGGWSFWVAFRALERLGTRPFQRGIAAGFAGIAIAWGSSWLAHGIPFRVFFTERVEDSSPVDVESVYYRQPALLADVLASVAPQRPGVEDVFFVGYGSYAGQDVFMKEVAFVRDLIGREFDASERSVSLVNHGETVDRLPLANPPNLGTTLHALAGAMDLAEDVLFLFLTSHGSRDGELSADFFRIDPSPLRASALRDLLDGSGIRWRIIVVSACYSGTFIDALRDEDSLILTASSRDRNSFGCGNDRDLTYFGEHFFADQLGSGLPLLEAFERAHETLRRREESEGYLFSDPKRVVGSRMQAKLASLETSRRKRAGHGDPDRMRLD